MSLTVLSRPAGWAEALNPVLYKLQRKDKLWNTITDNGGFTRITITGANETAFFVAGDTIYVKSSSGDYDEFATVTGSSFSGGDTRIETDIVYHASADGGSADDFINNLTRRLGYHVDVMFKDADDEDLLEDELSFTPTRKGLVTIDAQILSSILSPELSEVPSVNGVELDTGRFQEYYVSYTEVWAGSAESQTNDSAQHRFVALGELPIKGENDMQVRIPGRWLTLFNECRLFIGKYFDIPFFGFGVYTLFVQRLFQGVALETEHFSVAIGLGRFRIVQKSNEDQIRVHVASAVQTILAPNTGWSNVAGTWVFSATTLESNANETCQQPLLAPTGFTVTFNILVTITGAWTGRVDLQFYLVDATSLAKSDQNNDVNALLQYTSNIADDPRQVSLTVVSGGGFTETDVAFLRVQRTNAGVAGTPVVTITLTTGEVVSYDQEDLASSVKSIRVVEPCERPVTLGWKNSVGGQEWWTFDYNHEFGYRYDNARKARRMILFARDLTLNDWETLNGLNTVGEVYNPAIPELLSTVLGTQKRVNQQVVIMLDDNTLLEVTVIPTENRTMTKQERHELEITIELPEGYIGNDFFKVGTTTMDSDEISMDSDQITMDAT